MKTRRTCKVFAIALAMALCAALLVPAYAEEILPQPTALGESGSAVTPSSSSSGGGTTTPVGGEGTPYIAAYTVTDSAGNEIQRIQEGQKCRIIVAVVDPRINNPAMLTLPNGQPLLGNVKVVSTGTFASPSLGDISTTTFTADRVDANGLHFSIILNDIAYLGGTSNELVLDLAYNDNARALVTLKQGISQCGVASAEQGGKATALVVKSASYGSGDVTAGENFVLNAEILASNGTTGAENVTVSLKLPEEITVANGSSYLFVGNMKPGASAQASFQLTASAVAKAGSYNISIEVSGNSASDGAGLTATMPVTVPIIQPDRFEIANVNLPESLMVGQESYGTVSLVNKGKSAVYNVEAELVGEGFTVDEGSKKFIGNIESGAQNSQDFSITATQAGTITAQLVVTYEDAKATIKTLTRDVTMTVDEAMMGGGGMDDGMMGGGMDIPEQPQKGVPVWVWILIAVAVAAVVAVVTITIVKKKKAQRRAAQLMEEEDEDI